MAATSHPDKGGVNEVMSDINAAVDVLLTNWKDIQVLIKDAKNAKGRKVRQTMAKANQQDEPEEEVREEPVCWVCGVKEWPTMKLVRCRATKNHKTCGQWVHSCVNLPANRANVSRDRCSVGRDTIECVKCQSWYKKGMGGAGVK